MKVFMVGEAYKHKEELLAQTKLSLNIVGLPADAAFSSKYDQMISADDVVISLKYRRAADTKGGKFRLLQVPGAGIDGIDLPSLPEDVILCNVYEHQIPISEYVLLVMLEWEIRLAEMRSRFSYGKWSEEYFSRIPHGELHAKTLGLIGFGGIAKEIARRSKAFGMKIIAVDSYAGDEEGLADMLLRNEELDSVLSAADFLVVACPLTADTESMLNADVISKMKKSAVLINISRGPIVVQKDLYEALREERIAGAALDVWWRYPKASKDGTEPADYPFDSLGNVICTPHSCAWTKELTWRRYGVIAQNIEKLVDDLPLRNVVDYKKLRG